MIVELGNFWGKVDSKKISAIGVLECVLFIKYIGQEFTAYPYLVKYGGRVFTTRIERIDIEHSKKLALLGYERVINAIRKEKSCTLIEIEATFNGVNFTAFEVYRESIAIVENCPN